METRISHPFKTQTPNKAVETAREKALNNGHGLSTEQAKAIANKTRQNNQTKKNANKLFDMVTQQEQGHFLGSTTNKTIGEKWED